ncbi:DUF2142 domain-containing protein, partial [Cryobacterium roopkundense]
YAFVPSQSAECQTFHGEDSLIATDRGNFNSLYPPVFYMTMSAFVSGEPESSAVLMRSVSILLLVGIFCALWNLLPGNRRLTLVWGLVITSVPLGMFLLASNNPSSWAIISAGALWMSLLGYFESSGWRRAGLGALAVLALIIGAGARADASVYAVLAILVVCVLTVEKTWRWVGAALLPFLLVVVAVGFALSASQSSVALSGLGSPGPASWQSLFLVNLLEVPSLWVGVFGSWDLGWLDTHLPSVVWVGGLGVFVACVSVGLKESSIRKILAVGIVVASMCVIPAYILARSGAQVGTDVQPRYVLPLVVMLGGLALLDIDLWRFRLSWTQTLIPLTVLAGGNSLALHTNMRRYLTGLDERGPDLDAGAQWWWDISVSPMLVWAVGSLAFGGFLALLARETLSSGRERETVRVNVGTFDRER